MAWRIRTAGSEALHVVVFRLGDEEKNTNRRSGTFRRRKE